MDPICGSHARDEVGDPRPVLRDAHRRLSGSHGVADGHEGRPLLVAGTHEPQVFPPIQGVQDLQIGRAHQTEEILYPLCPQAFHYRFTRRHDNHSLFS